MSSDTALLVIDAKVNMFDESFPIYQGDTLLKQLEELIRRAREREITIVYLQNNGTKGEPDEPGIPGWEIHPSLQPREGDLVVQKYEPRSLSRSTGN